VRLRPAPPLCGDRFLRSPSAEVLVVASDTPLRTATTSTSPNPSSPKPTSPKPSSPRPSCPGRPRRTAVRAEPSERPSPCSPSAEVLVVAFDTPPRTATTSTSWHPSRPNPSHREPSERPSACAPSAEVLVVASDTPARTATTSTSPNPSRPNPSSREPSTRSTSGDRAALPRRALGAAGTLTA